MKKKHRRSDYEITFDEAAFDAVSGNLAIKEKPVEDRIFQLIAIIGLIIIFIAIFRSFLLGVGQADFYRERAEANVNQIILRQAPRGLILDRFGQPLVKNNSILTLYLRPAELIRNDELNDVIMALESIGLEREEFYLILNRIDLEKADMIAIKKKLTIKEAIKIREAGLLSLSVESDFSRVFESHLTHLVGYTGRTTREDIIKRNLTPIDSVGKSGLEDYYDDVLRGQNGKTIVFRNSLGEKIDERLLSEPQIGQNIVTTIDADLQRYFYQLLSQRLKDLNRTKGVGLAVNPLNGEILSLISLPSFNSDQIVEAMNDPDNPFFNRAVSGLYSPGSTIKPFWAVAALNEKLVQPTDQILSVGYIEIPNPYFPDRPTRFLDWKPHGWVNLYSAIARSSNVYFYALGGGLKEQAGLGIKRMMEYFYLFGLDKKTGINLPGESRGFILSPAEREKRTGQAWRLGDTYHISIGQGDVAVTPIGLLNAVASIVNGGQLYRPKLILNNSPEIIKEHSGIKPHFKEIVAGMIDTVEEPYGTSYFLSDLPMKIAAKTGSAQVANNKINAFWAGCGPMPIEESPAPICVLILIEDAIEGSLNTIPVAYDIMKWYYENRIK